MKEGAKLVTLFKSLGPWQVKAFRKYVSSSFVTPNEKVMVCVNHLLAYYPDFKSTDIKKIYSRVYHDDNFNHQKLRYLFTDITRLLENFLIHETLEQTPSVKEQLLLKAFHDRSLDKLFIRKAHDISQAFSTNKISLNESRQRLLFHEQQFEFSRMQSGRLHDDSLQHLSDSIDIYYLTLRLKYTCEILNRQKVVNENLKVPSMSVLNELIKCTDQRNPLIELYKAVLNLLIDYTEKNYALLKKEIRTHGGTVDINELREVYVFLQNFCIRMINKGNEHFLLELFDIYVEMINEEIIFENNELQHQQFKNIVTLALRLNKISWAEKFIQKNQLRLNKDYRQNAVTYNMARIYYARRKFREAMRAMRSIEYADMYYHLDSKILLLKIYYEMEDYEPLFSLIASVKIYLKRSKLISDYQRKIYSNLLVFLKKMTRYRAGDNINISKLQDSIQLNSDIADISWLKVKMSELN